MVVVVHRPLTQSRVVGWGWSHQRGRDTWIRESTVFGVFRHQANKQKKSYSNNWQLCNKQCFQLGLKSFFFCCEFNFSNIGILSVKICYISWNAIENFYRKAINKTHKTAELKNKFSKPFHTVKFEFNICKTISLREKFGVGNAKRFI